MNGYIIGGFSAVILVLSTIIVALFFYNKSIVSDLSKVKSDLEQAHKEIAAQTETITKLNNDAKQQVELFEKYQLSIDEIRNQNFKDLYEISQTDYAKDANVDSAALEKLINERTAKMLSNIESATKGLK